MADESCLDHHDAERLIQLEACDLINIKLGKSSGLHKAMKIAQLANYSRIGLQIGGFLESRLAFTASAHLAYACGIGTAIDFDTPLMHAEDYIEGGIVYHPGGAITLPETPGLGASVDATYLA